MARASRGSSRGRRYYGGSWKMGGAGVAAILALFLIPFSMCSRDEKRSPPRERIAPPRQEVELAVDPARSTKAAENTEPTTPVEQQQDAGRPPAPGPGYTWVEGYYRKSGTYVRGHWRRKG